jgi:hypothetical protein
MMGRVLALLVVASGVASSFAACNKNCFGKGQCGQFDRCACFHAWNYAQAQDCSQRVCPYGKAWGVTASGDARPYRECSDQGGCNRGTGECECFDGYTGHSCQRTTCPSGCSGRGQCQTIGTWGFAGSWDSEMTQACKCDAGYEGPACASRKCPKGDDPLSDGQGYEVQTITISGVDSGNAFVAAAVLSGTFALQLTDWSGQVHTTRSLDLAASTDLTIQEAIQALPNNAFPGVEVTITDTLTTSAATKAKRVIAVSFSSEENSGQQVPIEVVLGDANTDDDGNQPKVLAAVTAADHILVAVVSSKHGSAAEFTEGLVCSGRGSCSPDTGLCTCNQGFYGFSCSHQTALQ